jgi:hypothetical protein
MLMKNGRRQGPNNAREGTMRPELRRLAYREAAALLAADMDSADLPADLSEEDESRVREYIRLQIVAMLERHGRPRKPRR